MKRKTLLTSLRHLKKIGSERRRRRGLPSGVRLFIERLLGFLRCRLWNYYNSLRPGTGSRPSTAHPWHQRLWWTHVIDGSWFIDVFCESWRSFVFHFSVSFWFWLIKLRSSIFFLEFFLLLVCLFDLDSIRQIMSSSRCRSVISSFWTLSSKDLKV